MWSGELWVTRVESDIEITANDTTWEPGDELTFTAQMLRTGPAISGTMEFAINDTPTQTTTVNADGHATVTLAVPQPGDVVTARYSGNANYRTSTSTVGRTVGDAGRQYEVHALVAHRWSNGEPLYPLYYGT